MFQEREIGDDGSVEDRKQVMLEDGLEDLENLFTDISQDSVGAKYLKMTNSVSFNEMCSYVVELPISEHWRPDIKLAKINEVKNLMDYKTIK